MGGCEWWDERGEDDGATVPPSRGGWGASGAAGIARGPSAASGLARTVPARTRQKKRVSAAWAGTMVTAAYPAAVLSVPPRTVAGGALAGRAGAEPGLRAHLSHAPKSTISSAHHLPKSRGRGGRGGESRGRASAHEGCAQAGGGCDAGRARGGGGSPYTGAATLNKELHDGGSPPRGGPAAASPRGIGPRPLAALWPPGGHQPASVCVGAGRLEHQNKQRRHAGLSRSMPPSRVVERVEPCPGLDMSHPCTTCRWCRKCRCRTHAQSSPGRLSRFLSVSASSHLKVSEYVSGGS